MVNNTSEPRIVLPKGAVNVHFGTVADHLSEKLGKPLESFASEFVVYGRALQTDFGDDMRRAEVLIVMERQFIEAPSAQRAQELDAKWRDWTDQLFQRLIQAAADPRYPNLKRRLQEFVDTLGISRARFLL